MLISFPRSHLFKALRRLICFNLGEKRDYCPLFHTPLPVHYFHTQFEQILESTSRLFLHILILKMRKMCHIKFLVPLKQVKLLLKTSSYLEKFPLIIFLLQETLNKKKKLNKFFSRILCMTFSSRNKQPSPWLEVHYSNLLK